MKDFCSLFIASKENPTGVAFRCGEKELSFSEAEGLVEGLASKLSQFELGERVSVLSRNSVEMVLLIFALQRLGVSVVLHNTRLTVEDWKAQGELAGVRHCFASAEFLEAAPFETVLLIPTCSELSQTTCGELCRTNYQKEAIVIFTSGSTGTGKGVRLSLENLISNAQASNLVNDLAAGDCWLVSLPFYHVGGLCIVFRTILAGASALITDSQSAREVFSQLANVSHLSVVPSVLADILDFEGGYQRLSGLKNILLGGASADSQLLEKIIKLPVRTSYGMSETSSHICMLEKNEVLKPADLKTSGNLLQGVEIQISKQDEICIKSPSVFKGYLGEGERAADDWFFTGDLGSIDSKGRVIVEGRKDRTIISGGENINPKQIEDLALTCGGVREVAVVGVVDLKWGMRPVLYVVVEGKFSKKELTNLLQEKLPKFKNPDRVIVLDSLPRNAIGKIDYMRLRDV